MQRLGILILPLLLAACVGLPPQLALVTQAADGVSYVFTGKSGTDHLFSSAMKKDCALFRAVQGQAICKAHQGDSETIRDLSQVEGGHPGAALDRPIGQDETVALDPVLLPRELAGLAPDLGGAARPPYEPLIGPSAFAAPRPPVLPVDRPRSISKRDEKKKDPVVSPQREKTRQAPAPDTEASMPKAPRRGTPPSPVTDRSYYVVVGTYRNWVTALENAGRQNQGIASVVTAHVNGGKTHRVLIGPLNHKDARDTNRRVGLQGYRSARVVRSCAAIDRADTRARTCMDLVKTWR